ncbi:MAG: hypothetical protein L0027_05800 [Candidatus Rokubacteria bacterium]|nr:hypothetical protein [Candidatus Rokubacteria bacterium]
MGRWGDETTWRFSRGGRRRPSILLEGLIAGLAGAAAVALWFLVYDLAQGTPLRTPALLGAALFEGLRSPDGLVATDRLVLKYTAVHVLAFVLFGWAAAGLLALADRDRRVLIGVFMLFCCFQVAALAAMMILAQWLVEPIGWLSVVGANLLATLAMLAVFWRNHRLKPPATV